MFFFKRIYFLFILFIWSCKPYVNNYPDHRLVVDKMIDSAGNLADLKKRVQARRFVDSSFATIKNPGVGDIWKTYYFKQADYFLIAQLNKDSNELKLASLYADSMLSLLKANKAEIKYKHEYSISNFLKGDVLLEMEKYEQSYQYFHKGKLLADQSDSTCDQAAFNSRFAFLNYSQGKFRQAASLFFQAYKNNLDCKFDFEKYAAIQGALGNAGLSYMQLKMTDSAMYCFKSAITFIDKNKHLFPYKKGFTRAAKGVAYHYIADVYIDSGNNEKASEYLKRSIASNAMFGTEKKNAQIAILKLARLYLNSGKFRDFDLMMNFARLSIDSTPNPPTEMEWQKLKIDYLNLKGKYKEAKVLLPAYLKMVAKQNARLQKLNSLDARTEFYNLQKDYELTILKNENHLSDLYLIIAIGFSLMASFILYLTLRNWKTSRKNNSELKLLNQQVTEQNLHLQKALSALEQSQEENKRVMKVVAHDLRSPIGAIVSLAGFMLDEEKLHPEELQMMNLIKVSGSDSLKFVDELLNRESSNNTLEKELVDINALLSYCINLLQYKADEKQQKITLKSNSFSFYVNREKIWRVISNLITNAVKFSPPKTLINVTMETKIASVLISVKDHGIGIPDELKNIIFSINEDVKRSGTLGEQSFGMGLIISKQIVEAHNGKLWFESNSKGTTFFVELPIN